MIIFLMSTAEESFSQASDIPREVQEMIIASAETIKQNKITIDQQKKRIEDCKNALQEAMKALELCQQNHTICGEIDKNLTTQVDYYRSELEKMAANVKDNEEKLTKELTRKKTWRAVAVSTTLIAIVLILI